MPVDITIAAIEKELKIFKLKHAQNSDCIENRQELNFYLNILNRAFPPLSQEIELFDVEYDEQ
jgi:hypothetical protein